MVGAKAQGSLNRREAVVQYRHKKRAFGVLVVAASQLHS